MLVSELIELLQKEDQDSIILVSSSLNARNEYDPAAKIRKVMVKKNLSHRGACDFSGEYKTASMDKKTDDEVMGIRIV